MPETMMRASEGGSTAVLETPPLTVEVRSAEQKRKAPPVEGPPAGKQRRVAVCRTAEEMAEWIPQWEQLAASPAEPNVFYEHWMLLPAIGLYGSPQVRVAFVLEENGKPNSRPRLLGVLPLQDHARFRGMPVGAVSLWKHPHCYLANPLIASGMERECWATFFQWLRSDGNTGRVFEMQTLSADGPVWFSLQEYGFGQHLPMASEALYSRALLELADTGEGYLKRFMSGDHRRGYAKKKRQLAERGKLEFIALGADEDPGPWLEDFLRVEASGWKGQTATAMACQETDRKFMAEITLEAHRRKRLMMMKLSLDGQAIAMHHGVFAGEGGFALKIAYDEAYSQCSPGVLLEIEIIHHLHEQRPCAWMDCCSACGSLAMKRVWKQQRMITSVACPTGKLGSRTLVASLPLLRHVRRKARQALVRRPAVEA